MAPAETATMRTRRGPVRVELLPLTPPRPLAQGEPLPPHWPRGPGDAGARALVGRLHTRKGTPQ